MCLNSLANDSIKLTNNQNKNSHTSMQLQDRVSAFSALGVAIKNLTAREFEHICINAQSHNNWFTPDNIQAALDGIQHYLDKEKLKNWTTHYSLNPAKPKTVGLVMAGNIPLVGFHDFLSILISGHRAMIKPSHQDPFLLPYITDILLEIAPSFKDKVAFTDQLKAIDAIIATGSDNTSRYFKYYFSKYPHIIRKNRTSIAIITGKESKEELHALGKDIFQYYGLGCRNISKVYVPENYDFKAFFEAIQPYEKVRDNHKYVNNYDYNKSIYLVNKVPHEDNGFLLATPSLQLVSPISVLYYEAYSNTEDLNANIGEAHEKIQCIVSDKGWFKNSFPFGKAQEPALDDYADGVDVMRFLEGV